VQFDGTESRSHRRFIETLLRIQEIGVFREADVLEGGLVGGLLEVEAAFVGDVHQGVATAVGRA